MTVIIKSKTSKVEVERILLKFTKSKSKKTLRNVFGKNIIEGDAIYIKKKMRNDWD